jgi:hypothetical protein
VLPTALRYLVEAVVALSLVTLLAGILYLALSVLQKRGAGTVRALTIVTGILTAAGALWIKASGAQVTTHDEARDTICTFYDHVQRKDFAQAFDLVHDARKEEMKQQGRTYEDFKKSSESVREYRNIQIDFEQAESNTSRLYWVSFDVKDSFPENRLSDDSWHSSSRMIDAGVVSGKKLLDIVMSDLGRYYDVPEEAVPKVREYLRKASLHFILEPAFIADVGDAIHLNRKPVNGVESWSHHIESVKLQTDNGWKIRSGLFPETFIGTYQPGAEHPMLPARSCPTK